jgi:hypothetical protein
MAKQHFINNWLDARRPHGECPNLVVLSERPDARKLVVPAVCKAVKDHLVGLAVIERIGGFKKAAKVIKNRLPTSKAIRSGDLGEILATEYVAQKTTYTVPIKRLRHKDDRQTSMRGDDVIGIRSAKGRRVQVLKVEAKSRAALATAVIEEA